MLNGPNKTLLICATSLLALILAGLFVLVWHGSISGDAALGVVAGIVTALLAIFGVHSGVSAGAQAAVLTPTADAPAQDPVTVKPAAVEDVSE